MGKLIGHHSPWSVGHRIGWGEIHFEAAVISILMAKFGEASKEMGDWGEAAQFYAEAARTHPGGLRVGSTGIREVTATYWWIFGYPGPHQVYRDLRRKTPTEMWSVDALWRRADLMSGRHWPSAVDRDERGSVARSPFDGSAAYIPLRWARVDRSPAGEPDEPQAG